MSPLKGFTQEHDAEYAPGGSETCLRCHGESGFYPAADIFHSVHGRKHPQTPFGEGQQGCQTCHGPSAAHLSTDAEGRRPPPAIRFNTEQPPEAGNDACLDCHRGAVGTHWAASVHNFEALSCASCHRLHEQRDPATERAAQNQMCFDCHQSQRRDFLRISAHPLGDGLQVCSDCHQPHGGGGEAMLRASNLNESCYECHAEKRGPFLWEHAPVREDCSNCHTPHGSNHRPLLQARTPFLCQQCHLAQFHPSTALSGANRPPNGASQLLLGKDCMNCHSQVHGSNHPSGPGLVR